MHTYKLTLIFLIIFYNTLLEAKEKNQGISLTVSNYSATAYELVYDGSSKLSELIWKTDQAILAGIEVMYHKKKMPLLTFSYKKSFFAFESLMDDYDWMIPSTSEWSHWSHHENTLITDIDIIEIKASEKLDNSFSFSLGYRYEKSRWKAYDGFYIYSETSFRDTSGTFSGLGITYVQQFETFFASLDYHRKFNALHIHASVSHSLRGEAKDYDTHHARNIQFDSYFSNITYQSATLALSYNLSRNYFLKYDYTLVQYPEQKGYTRYTDLSSGYQTTYEGAGIASRYSLSTLALQYRF